MTKAPEIISKKVRARMIGKKIEDQFPKSPEGRLMFQVVNQALSDLVDNSTRSTAELNRRSAARYFKGEVVHAEQCDVDSDWIRRIIIDGGLSLDIAA